MPACPLRTTRAIAALCLLLAAILGAPGPAVAQPSVPDLILYNGKIFTSNATHPYVQALAIRGDHILATGDSAKMLALRSPSTKTIDLGGRTVIPGINDAHMHLDISPASVELPLRGRNPTRDDVLAAIHTSLLQAPPGSLLTAGVASAVYFDPRMTRSALDTVAPNNPVMLVTFTGHAAFLNSAALRKFGIREDQPNPLGGKYERGPDGKLTGVVREYALMNLERQLADGTPDAAALQQLQSQLTQAARFGITTIQDMSNIMTPDRAVTLLQKLPPTARVRIMRMPGTNTTGRNIQEGRPVPHPTSPLITVNGTKWMLDGTPLEGSFASRESRASSFSPPKDGAQTSSNSMESIFGNLDMLFPEPQLTAILRETRHDNDPLMLHVSGYTAASAMLKALQSNGGGEVWSTRRVRFEHGDGLYPDLIPAAKMLGIVVVQNPTHLAAGPLIPNLVLTKAQPLRSLLDAGIPVALGSDGPMNPYLNIMLASIHPDRPAEAITREQAVIAYTRGSAYAEFAENEKGTLEPGKLADLAVLSQDIFTVPPPNLPRTESVLTLMGGRAVYDAKVVRPQ